MLFRNTDNVKQALDKPFAHLTREELNDAATHVQFLKPEHANRYFAELLLRLSGDLISVKTALDQNREAIRSFDESSRRLNRRLICLTVVLVALTLVIAGFTILLWRRG